MILALLFSISAWAADPPFKPEICYAPNKKNYPEMTDPISDTSGADCASNTTEMHEKFPNTVEKLNRMEGDWTDANFRKRVTPLPKNKQFRDKEGNWIVNDLDMTTVTYRMNANKTGMWIQETSEDKKMKATVSDEMQVQICKKNNSMFLKTNSVEIPVAFPSKRCMWIGSGGKWYRFWRFQDIHFGFLTPTGSPDKAPATPQPATPQPATPVDVLPGPAAKPPMDMLPGPKDDFWKKSGTK